MNILFFDWTTFGDRDIVEALHLLGHSVFIGDIKPNSETKDLEFISKCEELLKQQTIDMVFTSNFSPLVAEACNRQNLTYVAWVYDSPQKLLYRKEIFYNTNYIFLFDSKQYENLLGCGCDRVFYMPLATNAKRMNDIVIDKTVEERYQCDVAFVGSLYNSEHNLYDRMRQRISDYDAGYLEAMMSAQKNVYGYYFLEELLAGNHILDNMYQAMPYGESQDSFMTKEYCYGNYFLGRKLATLERVEKLKMVSDMCKVKIYTDDNTSEIPNAYNMGSVNYYDEMPRAFRCAKINLNITLRTIQHGIPLRCFDIMGAGGFLLTNFQQDFLPLFEENVDYVYYDSEKDMMEKIRYYLVHEEERAIIARHGYETVCKAHSYVVRLQEILDIVCN